MATYVDEAQWPWRGMMWCHLTADTVEELHEMAQRLGLKREWYQFPKTRYPHYDLTESKRKIAVKFGAVEITCRELVVKSVALRNAAEIEHILEGPPSKGQSRRRLKS